MKPELMLPQEVRDYAWEVEAKGVFWDAVVRLGDIEVAVTSYDPARLAQDVIDELAEPPTVELRRVIVISSGTTEHMLDAVRRTPSEFFA